MHPRRALSARSVRSQGRLAMAQRPVLTFVENKIKSICGRWLDNFERENIEVSLLRANVSLSNVYLKTVSLSRHPRSS